MRLSIKLAIVIALLQVLGSCAVIRDVPRVPSHAISDGDRTNLGRVISEQSARHPGMSGFRVVADGRTAFVARAALADAAERTLDLQYYSVEQDRTTELLLLHIVAAAERGVRIRILLDDVHPSTRRFAYRASAAHPGIQVRLFNPFYSGGTSSLARLGEFIRDRERLNRRMHNKLWVADNVAAIAGSRNLGDEYFDANESLNFLDVDLLAAGPIAKDLSSAFDAYWNSTAVVPIEAFVEPADAAGRERVRETPRAGTTGCQAFAPCRWLEEDPLPADLRSGNVPWSWALSQLIYDPPQQDKVGASSGIGHGSVLAHPGGQSAQAEVLVVSPYFVPDEGLYRHLRVLRDRGVRVAILTNSLASTDAPAAHAGYSRHRVALLREGAELYEVRPESDLPHRFLHRWLHATSASLHAKVLVQDRQRASVGSVNQDSRSRLHNTEACIVLESTELAAELAALFDESIDAGHAFQVELEQRGDRPTLVWRSEERGQFVRSDDEPMTSHWLRLWRSMLGVLIPEHLL